MIFVTRSKFPLPLKLLVSIGVHWLNGSRRLVLSISTNCPPSAPLVAVIVNVVPFKLTSVICGVGTVTTKLSAPPLMANDAVAPVAIPPPFIVNDDGSVPFTKPPVLVEMIV